MEEIWKDVIGYEGIYMVSNMGNLKSLNYNHTGKERLLKPGINTVGYYSITLCKNNNRKNGNIHQLVAESFLNHKPDGYKIVVDHINDDKLDNRVENLQLITHRENVYKTQGKYSSKYIGVSWSKQNSKWRSLIQIDGKLKHLGYFTNEYEAHIAYQNKLNEITKV